MRTPRIVSISRRLYSTNRIKMDGPGPMVWIDCEMTGLDVDTDRIIEIACFVTDSDLQLVEKNGFEEVVSCPKAVLDAMSEWCVNQHGKSGLTAKVLQSRNTTREVEARLMDYLKNKCGITQPQTALLAGNSVHFDRAFLRREMPELTGFLNHRIIDVSTVKELARRRNPPVKANAPKKLYNHTAKSDILESIGELQYYFDHWLFKPGQGVVNTEPEQDKGVE